MISLRTYFDFLNLFGVIAGGVLPGEEVLREDVEDVRAEDAVLHDHVPALVGVADDRDLHVDDFELVGFGDLEGRLQDIQELGQLLVGHVLGALLVELAPDLVEEVVVLVRDPLKDVLSGLVHGKELGYNI